MLPRLEYLAFAHRWFGRVDYDLAASNPAPATAAELGDAPADDPSARDRLRSHVAARYGVPEREVVPVLGASGGLFAAFAALVGPGDHVLVESPGYEPMVRIPEALGARVGHFRRDPQRGFALDPDAVAAGLTDRTRVVGLTNPHNPSAALLDGDALARVARDLDRRGAHLLVDEAYLELARPAWTARTLAPNVVTVSSTTKCWATPWARAGWLLGPEELAEPALRAERLTCGVAPPSSWAWGERTFAAVDRLVARVAALQAGKRSVVDGFVQEHAASLEWVAPPPTSLYGWLHDRRGRPLAPAIERGIRQHGVIVSPGEFFDAPGWFRMSWTIDAGRLAEALDRLAKVLAP